MMKRQRLALIAFSLGLIGLGVLALVYRDFALVWQPVPISLSGRTAIAYLTGVLMVACGIGFFLRPSRAWSARILFPYLFVWLMLKVPALVVAPGLEAVWLGFGEIAVLFAAGWVLFFRFGIDISAAHRERWGFRPATILFGLALIPIGLSHILYTKQTVELIPVWLPARGVLAIGSGLAQIACGMAVLASFAPAVPAAMRRVAARTEAAIVALFAALVWTPAILAAPSQRLPWTAFFITWFFAASAWVVADSAPDERQ